MAVKESRLERETAENASYSKDFQAISYYSAPKDKVDVDWDDVDPELKATMDKLGISMDEQKKLSGVAVDFVMDSVSVKTSFQEKLGELGIIFGSFSDAVQDHPELVKKQRLAQIVELQQEHSAIRTKEHLNTIVEVLIEKESKKSNEQWSGRTPQNIVAVFPKGDYKVGDFVNVKITNCTTATLIGEGIGLSENN